MSSSTSRTKEWGEKKNILCAALGERLIAGWGREREEKVLLTTTARGNNNNCNNNTNKQEQQQKQHRAADCHDRRKVQRKNK